jgi:FkbM family methyltransferase
MVIYRPETPLQQVLHALRNVPGYVGLSARRKLARRYGKRAVADFDTRLRQIGPGDAVVDMGANVGLFTARLADTGAEVHAWEPDPYAFDHLTNRFSGLGNVHLHNAAVAQRPGQLRLARKAAFDRDPGRYSTASSIIVRLRSPRKSNLTRPAFSTSSLSNCDTGEASLPVA